MNPSGSQFTSIGGQAVIEGVMMRAPHFIAVAVRKPNRRIIIKNLPYASISQRFSFLKKPVLRGVVTLLESMFQGISALSYSANIAATGATTEGGGVTDNNRTNNDDSELSGWAIAFSISLAIVFGMGLFVVLPHFLTALITSHWMTAQNPLFHLLDGGIKVVILLAYIYLIALMKDIHRVFQYHGAEHKSIYTFEAGQELTIENARKHSTLHPRCGTSFLLFLVFISIMVFSAIFPIFQLTELSKNTVLNHALMIVIKIFLMLPVAGLSYEFIKMCANHMDKLVFRMMVWPGLVLQNLTTREPSDDQLEVALASLRQVLRLEKEPEPEKEFEITSISDLTLVHARVAEFPEV